MQKSAWRGPWRGPGSRRAEVMEVAKANMISIRRKLMLFILEIYEIYIDLRFNMLYIL